MTTLTETPAAATAPRTGLRPLMYRLAGGSMIAGAALFMAGFVTSPTQESESMSDYVVALGRDPMLTEWSALLLHYGNVFVGVAALVLPFLVRGRRGRGLTLAGALMMVVGFVNTSGAVLSDWWIMEAEHRLPLDQATSLSEAVQAAPLLMAWIGFQDIALVGVVVALAGLARAGVLSWWLVPAPVVAFAAAFAVPLSLPLVVSAVLGLAFVPLAWTGVIALRRARTEA